MMMPRQLLFIKSSLFSITVFDEKRKKCATYSNDGPKNVACNTRPRPHRKFVWVHWFAYVSRPSLDSCAGISSHSCIMYVQFYIVLPYGMPSTVRWKWQGPELFRIVSLYFSFDCVLFICSSLSRQIVRYIPHVGHGHMSSAIWTTAKLHLLLP